jgi:hypothetical protein
MTSPLLAAPSYRRQILSEYLRSQFDRVITAEAYTLVHGKDDSEHFLTMSKEDLFVHVREIGYSAVGEVMADMQEVTKTLIEHGGDVIFHLEGLTGHPKSWPC